MNDAVREQKLKDFIKQVNKRLVVSCQALSGEALFGADIMAKMALAAERGGASAIRANTPVDVQAIKQAVELPVIGLYKEVLPGTSVIITPTWKHALALAEVGADVIALDATERLHPEDDVPTLIEKIHEQTDYLVMADISTLSEGIAAEAAGADVVSTTLSGYTSYSTQQEMPDIDLIKQLAKSVSIPVFGEGRYHTPEQVKQALNAGATAVVVGGAITRPREITARYVKVIKS